MPLSKVNADQLDLVATEFEPSGTGSRQLSLKAGGVSEGKLGFSWETVGIPASSFTYDGTTRSSYTLTTAASSNANVDENAELLQNGIGGLPRVVTTATTYDWSLSGTTLSVHGDVTATGDSYTLRYIVGTGSGSVSSAQSLLWLATLPQSPLEPETDYFQDNSLDAKWALLNPRTNITVTEDDQGVSVLQTSFAGANVAGIYQTAPADDQFCVTAEIRLVGLAANLCSFGILAGEAFTGPTDNTTPLATLELQVNSTTWGIFFVDRASSLGANAVEETFDSAFPNRLFLRWFVDRTSGGSLTPLVSPDGRSWVKVGPALAWASLNLTDVNDIGLMINNNASGEDQNLRSSMFRVDITSDPHLPIGGYVGVGGGSRNTYGPYATPPNYPTLYDIHKTSDGPYERIWTGSAWQDRLPGSGNITAPPETGWAWFNQGTSTVATLGGVRRYLIQTGTTFRGQYRSQPATPYTVEFGFNSQGAASTSPIFVGWEDSGLNRQLVAGINGPSGYLGSRRTNWAFTADAFVTLNVHLSPTIFRFRFENDGVNLNIYEVFVNGDAQLLYTEAVGAFLTPDRMVISAAPGVPSVAGSITERPVLLYSYEVV